MQVQAGDLVLVPQCVSSLRRASATAAVRPAVVGAVHRHWRRPRGQVALGGGRRTGGRRQAARRRRSGSSGGRLPPEGRQGASRDHRRVGPGRALAARRRPDRRPHAPPTGRPRLVVHCPTPPLEGGPGWRGRPALATEGGVGCSSVKGAPAGRRRRAGRCWPAGGCRNRASASRVESTNLPGQGPTTSATAASRSAEAPASRSLWSMPRWA